jgi:hypothetical protein
VALPDAADEPGLAASGTNSGIPHTGFDSPPGERETELILPGAALRDPVLEVLWVPVLRRGAILRRLTEAQRSAVGGLAAKVAVLVRVYSARHGWLALMVSGCLAGAGLAFGPAAASASVLDVGDSLTVGSSSTLKQIVPGIEINAETGRTSSTGVSILADEYRGQSAVVFDLGTNDRPSPGAFLANLARVRQMIGGACLIVSTINGPPVNGVSYAALNRSIENFAFRDGNTQVVPWQLATKLHPEVVYSDGVHVTPYGYEFRAHLIAAISACPGGGSAAP